MNKQHVRQVVASLAETTSASGSGWVRVHCPFCEESGHRSTSKNLAINPESGYFRCWRWESCGTKGNMYGRAGNGTVLSQDYAPLSIEDVLMQMQQVMDGKEPTARAEPVLKKPVVEELPSFHPIDPAAPGMATLHLMYLRKRRVPRQAIKAVGIGYSTDPVWANYIIIPIVNGGQYHGFVARNMMEKRYKNSAGYTRENLFNRDALLEDTEVPVAIVEGLFDALPHWPYAVACNGKPTDAQLDVIAKTKRPICMMLDADAQLVGDMAALRLRMRGKQVHTARLSPGTDPGELDSEQFADLLFGGAS
jgi:hypothetical protein